MNSKTPAVFVGHGSPMNAIADNAYTHALAQLGKRLGKPKAVLCISAHWMTSGTLVTHMPWPKTIHDFQGFPSALYDIHYSAPGDSALAQKITEMISEPQIELDERYGLDHGSWSPLRHMFPNADIPVLQLSLDGREHPAFHFELGRKLRPLREEGVVILGSGNIVHNLRHIDWNEKAEPAAPAVEFNQAVRDKLIRRDFQPLLESLPATPAGRFSVPTPEHYLPVLYILGASYDDEPCKIEYDEIQNASASMLCFSFGAS